MSPLRSATTTESVAPATTESVAPATTSPRFHIQTFGCQMNVHDSQRMEDALLAHGWTAATAEDDADLIVLNTCSVREKAEHKLRSEVGRLKPLKRSRPDLVIAIAGCVAQQEGERLLESIPHVDVVVGPDNLGELAALAEAVRMGAPPVVRTVFDIDDPVFLAATPTLAGRRAPISAFVTTMKGCDERCSFCIVPYTRGPERYRALDEIVSEVRTLVSAGAREITLLGQTVNSWLPPTEHVLRDGTAVDFESEHLEQSAFAHLLRTLAREVPELGRLRYTSPHPRHLTPHLIDAHRELTVLAQHVHMPVQSGSNRMLRRMIRRYTREQYVERTNSLKAARAGLTLSTDIIVGFPGETDDDFEATLSLVREVGFVALFAFKFSPRPYTPALKLTDDVPESVKSTRLSALFETVDKQQRTHLSSLVDTVVTVLIEGESRPASVKADAARNHHDTRDPRVMGRSQRNEIVHVEVPRDRDFGPLFGRFVEKLIGPRK